MRCLMLATGLCLIVLVLVGIFSRVGLMARSADTGSYEDLDLLHEVQQDQPPPTAAIATSNREATEIGAQVLEQGGNAVDAAIAAAYAISVAAPHSGGVGGGGGALVMLEGEAPHFIDFREMTDGSAVLRDDRLGIPGFTLGMQSLSEKFGTMPISKLIEPSIRLAEDGIQLTPEFHTLLTRWEKRIDRDNSAFFEGGVLKQPGETVRQPAAADTLRLIATHGPLSYYEDILSPHYPSLVFDESVLENLVVDREPVSQTMGGIDFISAPPPFSGETTLDIFFGMADSNAVPLWRASAAEISRFAELVATAYSVRARTLADPSYPHTTSDEYVDHVNYDEESISTSHISVVDSTGSAVSMTISLGYYFGSGNPVGGFFTNSVLAFSADGPNKFAPFKKVRTFMSPSILKDENAVMAFGSPGGNRIPQIISQFLLSYTKDNSLEHAVNNPRILVERNTIMFEMVADSALEESLESFGYSPVINADPALFGAVNTARWTSSGATAYADPRRNGVAKAVNTHD